MMPACSGMLLLEFCFFPPILPGSFETSFAVIVTPGGKLTLRQQRLSAGTAAEVPVFGNPCMKN